MDYSQWDFRVYYYATRAYNEGLNPYDSDNWSGIARTQEHLVFHYAPMVILLFKAFTWMDYVTANYVFLVLKLILLVFIVLIWKNKFLGNKEDLLPFLAFCLLAYNVTIYEDFFVGNVSIIEQFFLWSAFYLFLQRRMLFFCLFILAASVFKITPLFFLILLLFTTERRKYLYLFGSVALFSALLLVIYLTKPGLFLDFVSSSQDMFSERGRVNPSLYCFISDTCTLIAEKAGLLPSPPVAISIFVIIAVAILVMTWRTVRHAGFLAFANKEKIIIFLIVLAYALIHPRFKDYSFILLIPPTYFLMQSIRKYYWPLFLVVTLLPMPMIQLPGFISFLEKWAEYAPILAAFAVWCLYLLDTKSSSVNVNAS